YFYDYCFFVSNDPATTSIHPLSLHDALPISDVNVPVLIVGGGGCGLTSSILLSELGVETLLVERHDSTSPVPKAHYLNQRTMEIFRQFGIAEPIVAAGAPLEAFGKATWRTSLGGDGLLDGKVIHAMDAFGGGQLRE